MARDYRETSFVLLTSLCTIRYSGVILSTRHKWVANYVCFKGQLLLLIICDGGSSLHFYMADKHPTLCMVDSDEQFLNQHSFGCKIVRAWSSLLS